MSKLTDEEILALTPEEVKIIIDNVFARYAAEALESVNATYAEELLRLEEFDAKFKHPEIGEWTYDTPPTYENILMAVLVGQQVTIRILASGCSKDAYQGSEFWLGILKRAKNPGWVDTYGLTHDKRMAVLKKAVVNNWKNFKREMRDAS